MHDVICFCYRMSFLFMTNERPVSTHTEHSGGSKWALLSAGASSIRTAVNDLIYSYSLHLRVARADHWRFLCLILVCCLFFSFLSLFRGRNFVQFRFFDMRINVCVM